MPSSVLLTGSLILFDILTNQKDSVGDTDSEKVSDRFSCTIS